MSEPIRFDDGAAYERYMGVWSRQVGEVFLDWLVVPPAQRWLDVGCGNGAFTVQIARRCAPAALHGVDLSEAQLRYARQQPALRGAEFSPGDAMALPFGDDCFDAAVMPLVIFFVPEPSVGVAEMARVVRPGGLVASYAWDMPGGGFPYETLRAEMANLGVEMPSAPSPEASALEELTRLWSEAGLRGIRTRRIEVQRTFADFEDYWATVLGSPSAGAKLAAMSGPQIDVLRQRLRERLAPSADGSIRCSAVANAVQGLRPG